MNVLFRCDGSVEIGMGHVIRCLALADELSDNHNCNIHFAMRRSALGVTKVKESYPVLESNEEEFDYENWLEDCINKTESKILILDVRDGLARQELKQLKKKTEIKVVTIDDPEDKRLETDLAFYPAVPQLERANWNGFEGELHVGWEYVILRKEFSQTYSKPNNPVPNILVFMGGTDEKNITRFVVETLGLIEAGFTANIILGSGYQYKEDLVNILAKVEYNYFIYEDPHNIAETISQSDFGIISFGVSAYELAALKVPAMYLCLTSDHEESSKLFVNKGVGVSMGQNLKIQKKDFTKAVEILLREKQRLYEIVHSANSLEISRLNKISKIILGN